MKNFKSKIACILTSMILATLLMICGVFAAVQQTAQFSGAVAFTATTASDNVAATVTLTTSGATTEVNSSISFTAGEATQTKENSGLAVAIGSSGIVEFTVTVENTGDCAITASMVKTLVDGTNYTVSAITETGVSSIAAGASGTFVFTVTVSDMLQAVASTDFTLTVVLDKA